MISQAEAEKAWEYLRDTAKEAAKKESERGYIEDYKSVLLATLMSEHIDMAVHAQEREAKKDPRFKEHLEIVKFAIEKDVEIRYLRKAAEMKVSMWQTQSKLNNL